MPDYYVALFTGDPSVPVNGGLAQEVPAGYGYARKLVTLPDGGGNNPATVTFGPIAWTAAFPSPSDQPNSLIVPYVGICSGPTAGVNDVIASTNLPALGSDGQFLTGFGPTVDDAGHPVGITGQPLMRGESIVFPAGALTFNTNNVRLSLAGGIHVSPSRGFVPYPGFVVKRWPNKPDFPVYDVSATDFNQCHNARVARYFYDYWSWESTRMLQDSRERWIISRWPSDPPGTDQTPEEKVAAWLARMLADVEAVEAAARTAGCNLS